jgi:predicted ATPase
MVLLERESHLAALRDYAGEAVQGEGRLILVNGEAGIGKSALVEHLAAEMPAARWSWGACDGLFTPRPLGPLFDLAGQLGGELADLCRARAPREDLFGALLRQISERRRLNVVVIEDVHWADEATVDLLRFLGRRIRLASALLVATYRDDGLSAGDPLRIALGELANQRSTRRIALAPLSADAVRTLASGSKFAAADLFRLTGGNPFYVNEVVTAGTDEIPPSARDAVLARTARLGGQARHALDVAALIGSRVDVSLLETVAGCQPADLDELVSSGLIIGEGSGLRFRHEIARLAVAQAVAAHRGGPLHARILKALLSLGSDDDASLAYHAEVACCGSRRRPPAVPPSLPHTGRQPPSTGGLCGSPRTLGLASALRCTTAWRPSCPWWTGGRTRPTRASTRSRTGARPVTGYARATRCACCRARCGG